MAATGDHSKLGGMIVVVIFVFTLFSFVVESELTQYVQTKLGYRHPFFIFYIVHSTFSIMFPLHMLYLITTTNYTISALMKGLSLAITQHLAGPSPPAKFPLFHFLFLSLALTAGITWPALTWFASITMASVSDVTAIWNTNAFFAYLISVKLFNLKWEPRRLVAVSLATLGVIAVVYGSSTASPFAAPTPEKRSVAPSTGSSTPLIGDLLTVCASFGYGLYQVLYKKYAALPSDPDELITAGDAYLPIPDSEGQSDGPPIDDCDVVYPPPFALHSNLLTSMIGVCTLLVLWIPIPLLHWTGKEPFVLPSNLITVLSIAGIALSGVVFNAGVMVLLGAWGPIITSVGNLLTIVLVFLTDVLIRGATQAITIYSVMGSGVIVAAFGMLAYDMYTT